MKTIIKMIPMKKLVLLLLLLFTGISNAQIVNIPDPVFKAKLLSANSSNQIASTATPVYNPSNILASVSSYNSIDVNGDGEIQVSEALSITFLNVSGSYSQNGNIHDLTGVEYFTNIQILGCSYNQLTSLDVSSNTALAGLSCDYNQLTSLNVSSNTALTDLFCSSNQLTSLNVSSNTALTNLYCLYNQLSSLNVSSNTALTGLICDNNQLTSLDVSSNTALSDLYCYNNQLTSLDVSNNVALRILYCYNNLLASLNVSSNTALRELSCSNNQLTSLDVSSNTALKMLYCYSNPLTSLDVSNNVALTELSCSNNQLTSLDVSSNTALSWLDCSSNQLTSLDVSSNIVLTGLFCFLNQLTSLNVNSNTALTDLNCSSNPLTSLNVSSNTALTRLDCYNDQLTSLNLSSITGLNSLNCSYNQLTSLNVSSNTALTQLNCGYNQLTSLDVSSNTALSDLYCYNNQLTSLFIKNGKNENLLDFSNNPNLAYICADEAQISSIQAQANANVVVSSYCSFTPGGNYNTVSGVVRFDMDNNGCDASDSALPNSVHLNISDGTVSSGTFPTTNGSYSLYTLTGTNTLTPSLENPSYFTISPATSTITTTTLGNTQTQDFCISANGVHNDLEVVVSPVNPARPGFDAVYNVVYKNKGNQTLSGNVSFTYDDAVLDYISSSVNPNTQSTGNLTWSYTNLLPFESRSINVTLNVNSPVETPAVNIGDVLNLNASITPVTADEIPADNSFTYNQTVVGAFDPNNIICLEGASVSPSTIGDYLHYAINFENTGNYPAENIVVKTTIDPTKFDINSLQLLNTSNPVEARITGNVVEFIFKNIHLATGGHGHILLKMRSNVTLVSGDSVSKRADIFFDYNAPIDTGLVNTVFEALSNSIVTLDNSVSIYPNPAKNNVNINCNSTIKSIQLFDIQGRILTTKIVDDSQSNFDISNYSNGVYFVKITTEKGSKVEKIIKE